MKHADRWTNMTAHMDVCLASLVPEQILIYSIQDLNHHRLVSGEYEHYNSKNMGPEA